jgi:hypothetical protein
MHTLDLAESGTSCGKGDGAQTRISLAKRRIPPTEENILIVAANSTVQDQTTATQIRWPGFHDILYMLPLTKQEHTNELLIYRVIFKY